jgi:hypothetical protein
VSTDPKDMVERLLGPAAPEVTCEACFAHLDEYVDLEVSGEDAEARLPGMRAHFAGCPACDEDHESLLALVASSDDD